MQVAKYTWREVNRGAYVVGSPDRGGNWLIGSSLSASSPRQDPPATIVTPKRHEVH